MWEQLRFLTVHIYAVRGPIYKLVMKFQFCKTSEHMLDLISIITYDSLVQ